MTVPIPKIDDLTYDRLRQLLIGEIQSLITNSSEGGGAGAIAWDDHNPSDPGIALVELLAAMGESISYRCDQIPPAIYHNFLRLVLDRPEPVTAEIRFVLPERLSSVELTSLPAGFPPVPSPEFTHSAGWLTYAGVMDGARFTALRDIAGGDAAYRDAIQQLYLLSNRKITIPAGTQLSEGGLSEIFETVRSVSIRSPRIYADATARHLALDPDLPISLETSNGDASQTRIIHTRTNDGPVWPVLLDAGKDKTYDPNPRIRVSYTGDSGPVVETWSYVQDLLEVGLHDNVFTVDWLSYEIRFGDNVNGRIPPRDATLQIIHLQRVDGQFRQRDVPDINSISIDRVAVALNELPAGVNLAVSPGTSYDSERKLLQQAGALTNSLRLQLFSQSTETLYRSAVQALYDVSNMAVGNTADFAGDIIAGVGLTPLFATGGRHLFDLENAFVEGLLEFKQLERAITANDYETLVREDFNRLVEHNGLPVRRVHARRLNDNGSVAVIVIQDSGPGDATPGATREVLQRVHQFLDRRRLITTRISVQAPAYRSVPIRVTVMTTFTDVAGPLKDAIVRSIKNYFHPLTGGDDGNGWPLGHPLYRSEIFRLIHQFDAVSHVSRVGIGGLVDPDLFELQPLELPEVAISSSDVTIRTDS